jgi:hypothetical protein
MGVKYIPIPEKVLINANHKTGKLKNSKLYNPTQKEHKRLLRKDILKQLTNKEARRRVRNMTYEELIKLIKRL